MVRTALLLIGLLTACRSAVAPEPLDTSQRRMSPESACLGLHYFRSVNRLVDASGVVVCPEREVFVLTNGTTATYAIWGISPDLAFVGWELMTLDGWKKGYSQPGCFVPIQLTFLPPGEFIELRVLPYRGVGIPRFEQHEPEHLDIARALVSVTDLSTGESAIVRSQRLPIREPGLDRTGPQLFRTEFPSAMDLVAEQTPLSNLVP